MRFRRLAVAAVAVLTAIPAAIPLSGAIAAPSTTSELPSALADPVEPNLLEYTGGIQHLRGFFDAGQFANWAGTDASSRQGIRDMLTSNGFVTGYQREWFTSNDSDALFETVFVFQKAAGADAMLSGEKDLFSSSGQFHAWVPIQLNGGSFAMQEVDGDLHWIFAGFIKGNDAFELFRGSTKDFPTSAGLGQATVMYSVAPDGTILAGTPQAQQPALSRFRTPVVVTLVIGALLLAMAIVIAAVATLVPRRTEPAIQGVLDQEAETRA